MNWCGSYSGPEKLKKGANRLRHKFKSGDHYTRFQEAHHQLTSVAVEVIEEIFYKMKLKKAYCSGVFKSLKCMRDLSYELVDVKQLLDPNYQEPSAISVISILDTSYGI